MDEELVTIATFTFVAEADATKMHLESEGIPTFLADDATVSMDWLLGNAIGNVKVRVPRSRAEQAYAIVEELRAERRRRAENAPTDTDAMACLSCGAAMPADASTCPACGWTYGSDAGDEKDEDD